MIQSSPWHGLAHLSHAVRHPTPLGPLSMKTKILSLLFQMAMKISEASCEVGKHFCGMDRCDKMSIACVL